MKRLLLMMLLIVVSGCSTPSFLSRLAPTGLPELHEPPLEETAE